MFAINAVTYGLARYPSFSATASTRRRVSGVTSGLLLSARETVIWAIPSCRAISRWLGMGRGDEGRIVLLVAGGFLIPSTGRHIDITKDKTTATKGILGGDALAKHPK